LPRSVEIDFLPDQILEFTMENKKLDDSKKGSQKSIPLPDFLKAFEIFCGENNIIKKPKFPIKNFICSMFQTDSIIYSIPQDKINETGFYILTRGTSAMKMFPIIEVRLNNKILSYIYVLSSDWLCYPVKLPKINFPSQANQSSQLELKYINDGALINVSKSGERIGLLEDRNLFFSVNLFKAKENDFE
jgi:hypothetical protein